MTVRTTMSVLIGRVRSLIGDPAGTSAVFTDQEVQDALDAYRTAVYNALLSSPAVKTPSGEQYLDFYALSGNWEDGAVIRDAAYTPLTPDTSEPLLGHWGFTTGQTPPLYISGRFYDVYGAAADLLTAWAAKEKLGFDFATDGQSFSRSQKIAGLLEMARQYRRQQSPLRVRVVRDDIAPGSVRSNDADA